MSAVMIAILAVAAISISLYPLFELERRPVHVAVTVDPNLENLLSAREATYSAIKDLESDHAMGKLSPADYGNLRAKYEGKALTILQQIDAAQPRAVSTPPTAAFTGVCAQCGMPAVAGKFCRHCGSEILPSPAGASLAATCGACGAAVAAGSQFCRLCGAPVGSLQAA